MAVALAKHWLLFYMFSFSTSHQVVKCVRSQRGLLVNLVRHCLPTLAESLYAQSLISRDVHEKVFNQNFSCNERSATLLNCIEDKVEVDPSVFSKIIGILKSEPYLSSLADHLISYVNGKDDCWQS